MNQELKQRAHKEFDEKFPIAYSHNALLGAYVSKNASVDIKTTFIDSLIDRTVQMTEERIKESVLMNMTSNKNGEYISVSTLFSIITNNSDINK